MVNLTKKISKRPLPRNTVNQMNPHDECTDHEVWDGQIRHVENHRRRNDNMTIQYQRQYDQHVANSSHWYCNEIGKYLQWYLQTKLWTTNNWQVMVTKLVDVTQAASTCGYDHIIKLMSTLRKIRLSEDFAANSNCLLVNWVQLSESF